MPQSTTPVDVDGDGDLDLLVIPQPGEDGVEATPVLLLNPGDGDFSDAYDTRVPLPNLPSDKIVGAVDATTDLDGDGLNDIVLVYDDPTQENLLVLNPGHPEGWDASALIALPAADGGSSEGLTSKDVVVVDLDGDGNFEILTADGGSGVGMTSSTFEVGAATADTPTARVLLTYSFWYHTSSWRLLFARGAGRPWNESARYTGRSNPYTCIAAAAKMLMPPRHTPASR